MFRGLIPALVTPFAGPSLALDEQALARNVQFMLDAGVDGLVACGTMGEASSLSAAERRNVISCVVNHTNPATPVIVGISAETAARAARYAQTAAHCGASGLMCLPPVNYAATDDEVMQFYREVTAATDLPVVIYNNPEASRRDMPASLVARLAELERVVAIKECSGDARRIAEVLAVTEGQLAVFVGGDDWALEGYAAGAHGWISGTANVAPRACRRLGELVASGDMRAAQTLNRQLLALAQLDMSPQLVQYYKEALDQIGQSGGPCRPPRGPLTDAGKDRVLAGLRAIEHELHTGTLAGRIRATASEPVAGS